MQVLRNPDDPFDTIDGVTTYPDLLAFYSAHPHLAAGWNVDGALSRRPFGVAVATDGYSEVVFCVPRRDEADLRNLSRGDYWSAAVGGDRFSVIGCVVRCDQASGEITALESELPWAAAISRYDPDTPTPRPQRPLVESKRL